MTEYWTIIDAKTEELLGIMECHEPNSEATETEVINNELGQKHLKYWFWGKEISRAEFETYQAFGIREIKL